MNTLVKNILAASAFIFAIGAALASTTAKITANPVAEGFVGQCIVSSVSANCSLTGGGDICTLISHPGVQGVQPSTGDCLTAQVYRKK